MARRKNSLARVLSISDVQVNKSIGDVTDEYVLDTQRRVLLPDLTNHELEDMWRYSKRFHETQCYQ